MKLMDRREYLLGGGATCPSCRRADWLNFGTPRVDGDDVVIDVLCENCMCKYREIYELTDMEVDNYPKEKIEARWMVTTGQFDDRGRMMIEQASKSQADEAFPALYRFNHTTQEWEWMADYASADDLMVLTGVTKIRWADETWPSF